MGNKREASTSPPAAGTGRSHHHGGVSGGHERQELHFSIWTAIATYFGYGVLIFFGHLRDYLRKWCGAKTNRAPEGYAPLSRDFEDFYTRRMYHRIQDCWNRPIASCPGAWIDLIDRKRAPQGSNIPPVQLKTTTRVINIGSYNYLGFGDPDSPTKDQVFGALERYSVGTSAPRSSVGTTSLHVELEQVVARFVGKSDAIVFGMGFGTNAGTVPALVGKGGLIISDATNHASIVVGARSSGASVKVFKHNDPEDLEAVIRRSILDGQPRTHRPWTKIMIIIEGIYSMEGELPPLQEIVRIKKKYGCYLYVDEAHSIGALGRTGRGICEEAGVAPADVDVLMGTFTKAFGSVGGYIAADHDTIAFIRQTNYGLINASPLSPPACQQVIAALGIMMGDDGTDIGATKLRALNENSNYFRYKAKQMGLHVLGDWGSPICPILLYNPAKIAAFSREMLDQKVAVVVVGYPATPLLLSRSRFCISAAHTKADLDLVLAATEIVSQKITIRYAGRAPIPVVDAPEHVVSLLTKPAEQWACYHKPLQTGVIPRNSFANQKPWGAAPKSMKIVDATDEHKYGGDTLVQDE